jgi:hypothetical protein
MSQPATERCNVELTSSPAAALIGGELVVGCERQESGDVWLYLGARYLNNYAVFPAGEDADRAERAWNATNSSHLWMRTSAASTDSGQA